jgi:hypothetical protein
VYLGNVLIIQEKGKNEPNSCPDDSAAGGTISFDFCEPVSFQFLQLLDIDDDDTLEFHYSDNRPVKAVAFPNTGDNGVGTEVYDEINVIRVRVKMAQSVGISKLSYCTPPVTPAPVSPTPVPTAPSVPTEPSVPTIPSEPTVPTVPTTPTVPHPSIQPPTSFLTNCRLPQPTLLHSISTHHIIYSTNPYTNTINTHIPHTNTSIRSTNVCTTTNNDLPNAANTNIPHTDNPI